jgi:hypothetical protein
LSFRDRFARRDDLEAFNAWCLPLSEGLILK